MKGVYSLQLIIMMTASKTATVATTTTTTAIISWLSSVDEIVQLVTKYSKELFKKPLIIGVGVVLTFLLVVGGTSVTLDT